MKCLVSAHGVRRLDLSRLTAGFDAQGRQGTIFGRIYHALRNSRNFSQRYSAMLLRLLDQTILYSSGRLEVASFAIFVKGDS